MKRWLHAFWDWLTYDKEADDAAQNMARAVHWWQTSGYGHPLTCGVDSNHTPLFPEVINLDDEIMCVLMCHDCRYMQTTIPAVVRAAYEKRDELPSANWFLGEDELPDGWRKVTP